MRVIFVFLPIFEWSRVIFKCYFEKGIFLRKFKVCFKNAVIELFFFIFFYILYTTFEWSRVNFKCYVEKCIFLHKFLMFCFKNVLL